MHLYQFELMGPEYVLKLVILWALVTVIAAGVSAIRRSRNRLGYIGLTDPARRQA